MIATVQPTLQGLQPGTDPTTAAGGTGLAAAAGGQHVTLRTPQQPQSSTSSNTSGIQPSSDPRVVATRWLIKFLGESEATFSNVSPWELCGPEWKHWTKQSTEDLIKKTVGFEGNLTDKPITKDQRVITTKAEYLVTMSVKLTALKGALEDPNLYSSATANPLHLRAELAEVRSLWEGMRDALLPPEELRKKKNSNSSKGTENSKTEAEVEDWSTLGAFEIGHLLRNGEVVQIVGAIGKDMVKEWNANHPQQRGGSNHNTPTATGNPSVSRSNNGPHSPLPGSQAPTSLTPGITAPPPSLHPGPPPAKKRKITKKTAVTVGKGYRVSLVNEEVCSPDISTISQTPQRVGSRNDTQQPPTFPSSTPRGPKYGGHPFDVTRLSQRSIQEWVKLALRNNPDCDPTSTMMAFSAAFADMGAAATDMEHIRLKRQSAARGMVKKENLSSYTQLAISTLCKPGKFCARWTGIIRAHCSQPGKGGMALDKIAAKGAEDKTFVPSLPMVMLIILLLFQKQIDHRVSIGEIEEAKRMEEDHRHCMMTLIRFGMLMNPTKLLEWWCQRWEDSQFGAEPLFKKMNDEFDYLFEDEDQRSTPAPNTAGCCARFNFAAVQCAPDKCFFSHTCIVCPGKEHAIISEKCESPVGAQLRKQMRDLRAQAQNRQYANWAQYNPNQQANNQYGKQPGRGGRGGARGGRGGRGGHRGGGKKKNVHWG